jgi:hypothetical protein
VLTKSQRRAIANRAQILSDCLHDGKTQCKKQRADLGDQDWGNEVLYLCAGASLVDHETFSSYHWLQGLPVLVPVGWRHFWCQASEVKDFLAAGADRINSNSAFPTSLPMAALMVSFV